MRLVNNKWQVEKNGNNCMSLTFEGCYSAGNFKIKSLNVSCHLTTCIATGTLLQFRVAPTEGRVARTLILRPLGRTRIEQLQEFAY